MEFKIDLGSYKEQTVITMFLRQYPSHLYFNPNVRRFMAKFVPSVQKAVSRRSEFRESGVLVPSMVSACVDEEFTEFEAGKGLRVRDVPVHESMSVSQWQKIFKEAYDLGIPMITLLCGSSFSKPELFEEAAKYPQIIFPIIIEYRLMNDDYIKFFDKNRNCIPILSLTPSATEVKPENIEAVKETEKQLHNNKIIYGAFVRVTKKNIDHVTSTDFIDDLKIRGNTGALYMQYIHAKGEKSVLTPSRSALNNFSSRVLDLNQEYPQSVFMFFDTDIDALMSSSYAGSNSNFNDINLKEYIHINSNGTMISHYDLSSLNAKTDNLTDTFKLMSKLEAESRADSD